MRGYCHRSKLAWALLVAVCVIAPAQPSHAMFLSFLKYVFFSPKKETHTEKRQGVLVGQKVHVFDLHNANAVDLQAPLQSYMDGTKSEGSLVIDPTKNALIVTETPENLARMGRLIESMDIAYSNPSPDARQILVTQQMMKAIHTMGPATASTGSTGSGLVSAQGGAVAAAPSGIYHPVSDAAEDVSRPQWKTIDERPSLGGFRVVGWVRDRRDTIVVLASTEGQRYLYRGGHLLEGHSFSSTSFIPGFSGRLTGNILMLQEPHQGKVFLNMVPPIDHLGARP